MSMRWLLVFALLFGSANLLAAEHAVKVISPGRLNMGDSELAVGISQSSPQIQRVLIVIHGRLRNAETYRQSAERAAEQAGQSATTLVIAPQFLNESDIARHQLPDSLLHWRGDDWMAGELSIGANPLSSYAVLDKILERLSDRQQFPTLKEVVIAGHSGGAQVVQRYALLGHDQPALQSAGVSVRYMIANPSSYAYFDDQRPVPFNAARCPGFNDWKYGLLKLPDYANGQPAQQLEQGYVQRNITYLLGQRDTNPHHPALDRSCAAETQGASRLVRGHRYFDYLQQRHPEGLNQQLIEVPGVGHNGDKMFTSPEGLKALFQ